MVGGLGASGALVALIFAVGLTHPDLQIGLVGLPEDVCLPASVGLLGLASLDLYGVVAGWRTLGHSAHLSGALGGYYAVEMGGFDHIRSYQKQVVRKYIDLKKRLGQ